MKRKSIAILVILLALLAATALVYFFGSGLMKQSSVYISDYTVSEDGQALTVQVGVGSSTGFVRKVAVHRQEGGKLYLDCYAAFGGINGSVGAKTTYTVPLAADTQTVALYRAPNAYRVVLEKDADGVWQRVMQ